MKKTVFIAHSSPLIRYGIARLVNNTPSLTLLGEAEDTQAAIKGISRLRPHIAMTEIVDGLDGIHICEVMKTKGVGARILIFAMEAYSKEVYNAITAGAVGYITRSESVEDIRRAVQNAMSGKITISYDAQTALQEYLQEQDAHSRAKADIPSPWPLLSAAELQILRHIAQGSSIAETAHLMYLSTSTVKNHRQSLFAKLSVRNAPAAIYTALKSGILN